MIVDGTETILIKVDEAKGYSPAEGSATYTINDKEYYADASITSLQAVNYRRSNLNLSKAVEGNAPEGATFPFTMTVNNSKAENGSADDTSSDYYVWFSVQNNDKNVERETDATLSKDEKTGAPYYYAESGKPISIELQDGDNLRFTNLPSETTYEFTEGDTAGFEFVKAVSTNEEDESIKPGKTTTGTIEEAGAISYGVEYTNKYVEPEPTSYDPPVLKIVKGEGANPADEFTFELKAVYAPEGLEEKPMPEGSKGNVKEMTAKAGVESEFGDIVFTVPGIYSYIISEKDTGLKGYTYDKTIYTVTFDVTVGEDNKLEAKREVKKDGEVCKEEVSKFEFTNVYDAKKPVKTGDTTVIVPYIVIGAAAIALLLMILFRRRKAN
jgi:pilin isopeptide linkage protein/LPXTG-motif cell wall-anchored protein